MRPPIDVMEKEFPCNCCHYYTWEQFEKDAALIARKLKEYFFDGVYAPPRGGLTLAVKLSHLLGIPYLQEPRSLKTLIVDDIADTGKTLNNLADKRHFTVTLFYHSQSEFVPTMWCRKKRKKYIIFPWEKQECVKKSPL